MQIIYTSQRLNNSITFTLRCDRRNNDCCAINTLTLFRDRGRCMGDENEEKKKEANVRYR
jgi:hypothetical protein